MKKYLFFNDKAEVYLIEKSEFIPAENISNSVLSVLSEEEKIKLAKYKNPKAKSAFLTARFYLRKLLSDRLKITQPSEIRIEIAETGKPFLKDYSKLFFNLSHTQNMIAIGFSEKSIGIDVESISRSVNKDSILKHYFSEKEQQSYYSIQQSERSTAFFVGWTRKEAVLKATGFGLSKMNNNEVSFDINSEKPIISDSQNMNYQIISFTATDNNIVSVAIL